MAYNLAEKALAVEIVHRNGGEVTIAVLQEIRAVLGKPTLTSASIRNWLKENLDEKKFASKKDANLSAAVEFDASQALDNIFEGIARRYLHHASQDEVVKATKGKDAVVAAATAVDKMRLLRGLPTDIVQLLPDVVKAIELLGQDPKDVFERIIQQAAEESEH